jgi:hypothetical protein
MVCPDMVAVLLDHHGDPNLRTVDGVTPLDIHPTLTSDFLFKGAVSGQAHIEPNKLRLLLELVQSRRPWSCLARTRTPRRRSLMPRRCTVSCWDQPSALAGIDRQLFCRSTVGSITCNREHDRAN